MINWTESQIIIAAIGMVGLLSTGVVAVYSFRETELVTDAINDRKT